MQVKRQETPPLLPFNGGNHLLSSWIICRNCPVESLWPFSCNFQDISQAADGTNDHQHDRHNIMLAKIKVFLIFLIRSVLVPVKRIRLLDNKMECLSLELVFCKAHDNGFIQ